MAEQVFDDLIGMIRAHRQLAVMKLHAKIVEFLKEYVGTHVNVQRVREELRAQSCSIEKALQQAEECQKALDDFNQEEEWIFSQTMFGISTFYKMDEEQDGSIWIKLEGDLVFDSLLSTFSRHPKE